MLKQETRRAIWTHIEKVSPENASSIVVILEEARADLKSSGKPYQEIEELIEAARDYHDLLVEVKGTINVVGYTQMARMLTLTEVSLLAFKDALTEDEFSARDMALGLLIEGAEVLASSEYTLLPVEEVKGLIARYAVRLTRYLWDIHHLFGHETGPNITPAGDIRTLVSYLLEEKVRIAERTVILVQTYRWILCAGLYAMVKAQALPRKK